MHNKELSAAKHKLLKKYASIFKKQLLDDKEGNIQTWAYKKTNNTSPIHPTIPFIGSNYFSSKAKVLLYASAENLAYLQNKNNKERSILDNDNIAKDRGRHFFEKYLKEKPDNPFPFVHITPVNNGALVVITAYLLKKFGINYEDPFRLIEDISAANFGKFSICNTDSKANKDYADPKNKENIRKLEISYEYVQADLEILKPEILIMPFKIYEYFKERLENPKITIFPIYQITPTTINSSKLIGRYKNQYKSTKDVKDLEKWHENIGKYAETLGGRGLIKDGTLEHFKAIYPYLDEIYKKYKTRKFVFS